MNAFRTFKISQIAEGVPRRLPGYFEECQRRGQIDARTGTITFTLRDFNEIRKMFNPKTGIQTIKPGCCGN